jgi:hypothetical protein
MDIHYRGKSIAEMTIAENPSLVSPNNNKVEGGGILGTIQQYYTVWCGHPDCDGATWEHMQGNTKAECAKTAKRFGWKLTKAYGWICPKHTRAGS